MNKGQRKAFTMLELVFVVVIIGILSAVAIPRFAVTRDDAILAKDKAVVGSVRSALVMERQKRILRGDFTPITSLNSTGTNVAFSTFSPDNNDKKADVLEYHVNDCTGLGKTKGCWSVIGTTYRYYMPLTGTVDFNITNGRFDCITPTDSNCKLLTL